jgi:hypothetical protein
MPTIRIPVRELRNDDELSIPGYGSYGTVRFLGWETTTPGTVDSRRLTFRAVTADGREVRIELRADYYFDVVRAPEALVPARPYTVEDALAEVADVVRGYEETASVEALLEAAQFAHERYQDNGESNEGHRLARTLLIAVWALHADIDSEYHPEEEFEHAAYGYAG